MLDRLRIRTRVVLTSATAVVLALAMGLVYLVGLRTLTDHSRALADGRFPVALVLSRYEEATTTIQGALNGLVNTGASEEDRAAFYDELADALRTVVIAEDEFAALPSSAAAREGWEALRPLWVGWKRDIMKVVGKQRERDELVNVGLGKSAQVAQIDLATVEAVRAARDSRAKLAAVLQGLVERTRAEVTEETRQSERLASRVTWAGLAALCLMALAMAGLSTVLVRGIGRQIGGLRREAGKLTAAVAAGALRERADVGAVGAEFRGVIEGMNATMDAFATPLQLTVDRVERISRGEIPERLDCAWQGDFATLQDSINRCIDAVNGLVADTRRLVESTARGDLAIRGDAARHEGEFRTVIEGFGRALDAVARPIRSAAERVARIARGEIPPPIDEPFQGEFETLRQSLNTCVGALADLLARMQAMTDAQEAGDLDAYIDEARFEGAYRNLAAGMNACVGGHVRSVLSILDVLGAYGDGDFAPTLPEYRGKRIVATQRVNALRANLVAVSAEIEALAAAASEGRLSVRADASRLKGDWAKLVGGLNATLDAVCAPVDEAARVLGRLAGRDLRARVVGRYQGDHAKIQEAVNATAEALQGALGQVAVAVDQVSGAAGQIASSSQAVASGASEQASALQETTQTVETVASAARQSAEHAEQASAAAGAARTAATAGAAAVEQLQGAMVRIRQASEGTSQIIRDVSEIAFQTNLLALNAAVEAARAGEAGRGFAVVAEEVRSLALRAKQAAARTEELIRQAVGEAGQGEAATRQVAGRLSEIVQGVGRVTDLVTEIAASARAQAAGVAQVTQSIAEMDRVTQQNAAAAEESSSAASELSGQAEQVDAMLSTFQLGDGGRDGAGAAGDRGPSRGRTSTRQVKPCTTIPSLPSSSTASSTRSSAG